MRGGDGRIRISAGGEYISVYIYMQEKRFGEGGRDGRGCAVGEGLDAAKNVSFLSLGENWEVVTDIY